MLKTEKPSATHIAEIEGKIGKLKESIKSFYDNSNMDLDELLRIIHRPPWTRPSDELFANCILDALIQNVNSAAMLNRSLRDASAKVGVT